MKTWLALIGGFNFGIFFDRLVAGYMGMALKDVWMPGFMAFAFLSSLALLHFIGKQKE